MFRIAALNLSEDEEEDSSCSYKGRTKEAQEEEAFSLYTTALGVLRQGKLSEAEQAFQNILDSTLVQEAPAPKITDEGGPLVHPGNQLKYSTHKNLASIATQCGHHETAMEQYIEAVKLDNSDVTVWYKSGLVAKKIHNYQLAKFCFAQGLQCNPLHWPCLHAIILVLYAINNYSDCLHFIGQALIKDPGYVRGLVIKRQIFTEIPYLRESTEKYFKSIAEVEDEVEEEEVEEVLREAEEIRAIRRQLSKTEPSPPLTLRRPLKQYTWLELAECILAQYDYCHNRRPPESLSAQLDLTSILQKDETPMDVDVRATSQTPKETATSEVTSKTEVAAVGDVTVSAGTSDVAMTSPSAAEAADSADGDVELVTSEEVPVASSDKIVKTESNTENTSEIEASETQTAATSENVEADQTIVTEMSSQNSSPKGTNDCSQPEVTSSSEALTSFVNPASVVDAAPVTSTVEVVSSSKLDATSVTSAVELKAVAPVVDETSANSVVAATSVTSAGTDDVPDVLTPVPINVDTPVPEMTSVVTSSENDVSKAATLENDVSKALFTGSQVVTLVERSGTDALDAIAEEFVILEEACKKRSGRKRKMSSVFDEENLLYCGKRRSLRVRNTADRHQKKKEEVTVNYSELLLKFLPNSLLQLSESEAEGPNETPGNVNKTDLQQSQITSADNLLVTNEVEEVEAFIKGQRTFCTTLELLTNFLHALKDRAAMVWPEKLCELYVKLYKRARRHFDYPCYYDCDEETKEMVRDDLRLILCWAELQVDEWNQIKQKTPSNSPTTMNRLSPPPYESLLADFPGDYFPGELHYLCGLVAFPDILQEFWEEFKIRVLWLNSKYLAIKNEMDRAVNVMTHLKGFLEFLETEKNGNDEKMEEEKEENVEKLSKSDPSVEKSVVEHRLPNCRVEPVINSASVKCQLESLERCQSLEELQKLYSEANYEQVINLLLPTFSLPINRGKLLVRRPAIPERHAQLLLLHDALLRSDDPLRCATWLEKSVHESLRWYVAASGNADKTDWSNTLMCLIDGLNKCLSENLSILPSLAGHSRIRLVRNLIRVIELAMDQNHLDMTISTLVPWILLYYFIQHEEAVQRSVRAADEPGEWSVSVPGSLSLLDVAHDLLGRHSWCTRSSGALLMFYARQLTKVLTDDKLTDEVEEHRSDLEESLEQCFYCLYGYPSKRRARNLSDHNAPQIELTWERAKDLFDYFTPEAVPEFDSYMANSISSELEGLLRRIVLLSPTPAPREVSDRLQNYIEGSLAKAPGVEEGTEKIPVLSEIYYLLGDHHFKNKEFAKAIKYYMLDLAYNPARFDSWAGMALSRSSKLEQRLNSMDNRCEGTIHKHADCTLRCYRRALSLDDTNHKLWIEYGTFAYQLQAYSSRQIKMSSVFPLSADAVTLARATKAEMLELAGECYTEAGECGTDEEAWLQQYIRGKVAEKTSKPPSVFLQYYQSAASFLHEDCARYPKRIHYIQTPPHMAVEALEMYYRTHVSVVKFLLRRLGTNPETADKAEKEVTCELVSVFEKYVEEAGESPFATGQQKKADGKEGATKESVEDVSSQSSLPKPPLAELPPSQDSALSAVESGITGTSKNENTTTTAKEKSVSETAMKKTLGSVSEGSVASPMPIDVESEGLDSSLEILDDNTGRIVAQKFIEEVLDKVLGEIASHEEGFQEIARAIETGVKRKFSTSDEEVEVKKKANLGPGNAVPKVKTESDENQDLCTSIIEEICNKAVKIESETPENLDLNSWMKALIVEKIESKLQEKSEQDAFAETLNSLTELANLSGSAVTTPVTVPVRKRDDSDTYRTLDDIEKSSKFDEKDTKTVGTKSEETTDEVDGIRTKGIRTVTKSGLSKDLDERAKNLMDKCIKAFHLCLTRFPTHYKSSYQLAIIYYKSPWHQSLSMCRDLLAGSSSWQQSDHMPCPGLFQDRKPSNFFNGVWRIPIEEIDRCGSFATHMYRCVSLMLQVLKEAGEFATLYACYQQLQRNPDGAKKYMRDQERITVAKRALKFSIQTMENSVTDDKLRDLKKTSKKQRKEFEQSRLKAKETIEIASDKEEESKLSLDEQKSKISHHEKCPDEMRSFLHAVYKIWSGLPRSGGEFKKVNKALIKAYRVYKPVETSGMGDAQVTDLASRTLSHNRRKDTGGGQERPATSVTVPVTAVSGAPPVPSASSTPIPKPLSPGGKPQNQAVTTSVTMVTKPVVKETKPVSMVTKEGTKVIRPAFVKLIDAAKVSSSPNSSPTTSSKSIVTSSGLKAKVKTKVTPITDTVSLISSDSDEEDKDDDDVISDDVMALADDVSSQSDKDSDYNPTDDEADDDDGVSARKRKRAKLSPSAVQPKFTVQTVPVNYNPMNTTSAGLSSAQAIALQQLRQLEPGLFKNQTQVPHSVVPGRTVQRPVGVAGIQRPVGVAGSQRPVGVAGSQRPVGVAGSQRPVGVAGIQRPVGVAGIQRPVGVAASQRPLGVAASQRPVGVAASQRPVGVAGSQQRAVRPVTQAAAARALTQQVQGLQRFPRGTQPMSGVRVRQPGVVRAPAAQGTPTVRQLITVSRASTAPSPGVPSGRGDIVRMTSTVRPRAPSPTTTVVRTPGSGVTGIRCTVRPNGQGISYVTTPVGGAGKSLVTARSASPAVPIAGSVRPATSILRPRSAVTQAPMSASPNLVRKPGPRPQSKQDQFRQKVRALLQHQMRTPSPRASVSMQARTISPSVVQAQTGPSASQTAPTVVYRPPAPKPKPKPKEDAIFAPLFQSDDVIELEDSD